MKDTKMQGSWKFSLCLVVALVLGMSCLKKPSDIPTIGTIIGVVTDGKTGNVLSGASIATNPSTTSVTSGADGSFSIPSIAAGTYSVTASKSGYVSSIQDIAVGGGATATANFALSPATGTISGVVTDGKTGAALNGVSISTNPSTASAK